MGRSGKRWTVQVYLTHERWKHITGENNHLEMVDYEEHLKMTVEKSRRRQEPLNPRKYRYYHPFDDLPDEANHVVAIVLFGFDIDERGQTTPNNFVVTAFFKHIRLKG